jgi:hypothetical protein
LGSGNSLNDPVVVRCAATETAASDIARQQSQLRAIAAAGVRGLTLIQTC